MKQIVLGVFCFVSFYSQDSFASENLSQDPFSQFLPSKDYRQIQDEIKGEFGGIGLVLSVRGEYPSVVKILADSPAESSGIQAGDEILEINQESCHKLGLAEVIRKIRGPLGTDVFLVLKQTSGEIVNLSLKRTRIRVESIREARIIASGIGYIKLVEFVESTRNDLDISLKQLKQEGARKLILDLRNNMGGSLTSAVGVAEKFLPKGSLVVKMIGDSPQDNLAYFACGVHPDVDMEILILVNRASASASEIVAGALKDHGRAKVVGEKTFGKGSVQTIYPLSDGQAIRLTRAHYLTPSGEFIDRKGIKPDIEWVFPEHSKSGESRFEEEDPVLEQTLALILGHEI